MNDQLRATILNDLKQSESVGARFVNAFLAFNEGKITVDDFAEECEEIFTEEANSTLCRSCESKLMRVIEHLLLIRYSGNSDARHHWEAEIENWRIDVEASLRWGGKHPETNVIKRLREQLPAIYTYGIRKYQKHDADNPQLDKVLRLLPEDCPWEFDELLTFPIDDLLSVLPSHRHGRTDTNTEGRRAHG